MVIAAGWGYSFGNWLYDGRLPWDADGAGWWDPPANTILDGRITLQFDPNAFQINEYGWFGDWGLDTSLLPPPTNLSPEDPAFAAGWVLQDPNPNLTTNVMLDNINGLFVVEYSWAAGGYTPPTDEHFNFFGYTYSVPAGMSNEELQQATTGNLGPGKMGLIGNTPDFSYLGDNSPTYMACNINGERTYCGTPVPGPLPLLGVGVAFSYARQLRRRTHQLRHKDRPLK
jgi:hypothetical protein